MISVTFDVNRFMGLIQDGVACFAEAGRMLDAELTKDPASKIVEEISKEYRVSRKFLRDLIRFGRGEVIQEVFGIQCLMNLPVEAQRRAAAGPVPLLCENGDILQVDLLATTVPIYAKLVSPKGIRTVEEQKQRAEHLAAEAKAKAVARVDAPWEVKGKTLHVYAPTMISKARLKKILEEMG